MYPYVNPLTGIAYQKDLYAIAQENHKVQTSFCSAYVTYSADDFDAIKRDFCAIRKQDLNSADAFHENGAHEYVFVEFKDMSLEYMDQKGHGTPKIDPKTGIEKQEETMEVALHKKAFDSLAVAGGTVCSNIARSDISKQAIFIVVRQDDPAAFTQFAQQLQALAGLGNKPLWGLEDLVNAGLYREVWTLQESEFGGLLQMLW